ncbi:DUF4386 domain-containing protein [Polaribacter aquimarinus]|uniref:DUF4386 domain-containing protein n=1 Tax=Polaribacter aquimarinus TaxID=2100726 RepID=A0A2U2JC70_9FLAO|nr:DUF4386 domain-containing protein [Polaribacter aquimarinus]PWG05937.1 DUF4386 domain-containing protein [Polaribacter aquimarinus]
MTSTKNKSRIVGILLLFIFITGVFIFQFLQGKILFSEDFTTLTSENENKIIISVLLGIFSGIASIIVSILLLPVFKKQHYNLAYLYVAFCIVNFISIMIDNYSVISMLEFSKEFLKTGYKDTSSINMMKTIIYQKHWWTHYFYLLISCLPVFILYYTLFVSKLIPRLLSIFGVFAVVLMSIQVFSSIFKNSISMNMMLPMAIIQITLPFWLIFKGLKKE